MKRDSIQNIKVMPYTSATAIDRDGFLSGILAVQTGSVGGGPSAMAVKITVTECDTESGNYTPAADKLIPIDKALDAAGSASFEADVKGNKLMNIDLDFVGCKRYVKVAAVATFTGGSGPSCTLTCALALGDPTEMPV